MGGSSNVKICFSDTNMLVSKIAKICLTPNVNIQFALPLMQSPNASKWNIGWVWSPTLNFRVGHVHFIFWDVDFIRVGSRFSVEHGLYILVPIAYPSRRVAFGTCIQKYVTAKYVYINLFNSHNQPIVKVMSFWSWTICFISMLYYFVI